MATCETFQLGPIPGKQHTTQTTVKNAIEPLSATPITHEGERMMLLNRPPIPSDGVFETNRELGFWMTFLLVPVELDGKTVKVGTFVKNVFGEDCSYGGSIYTIRNI